MAVLLAAFYCSYSYSDNEIVYGKANVAGYNWSMENVLPQQAGLEVTGVIYRYTAVKDPESDMVVYVQNKDAQGDGYIFREVDDWSQRPGKSIYKIIPTDNVLIDRWGDGSIEWTGQGKVEDPSVGYNFNYDPCFDPQTSPDCPGYIPPYIEIEQVEVIDPLDDNAIQDELDRKANLDDEDQEDSDRKRIKKKKKIDERLEKALGIVNTSLMAAAAQAKHTELMAMSIIPTAYISASISGGTYEETRAMIDTKLPENRDGLRNNLAQQLKHQEMVNLQYDNLNNKE